MSEAWERGDHPAQAEVHEPIEPEFTTEADQEITYGVFLHSSGPQGGYVVRTRYDGWCPAPYSKAEPVSVWESEQVAQHMADRLNGHGTRP